MSTQPSRPANGHESQPEPWLRGPVPGLHPAIGALIHSLQQAREDLARFTAGLSDEEVWARPHDLAPLGFHLRHIAGSTERLSVYLVGGVLNEAQLAAMRSEMSPGDSLATLLAAMDASFQRTEALVRTIDPATLAEPRGIGRKQLPTTVAGLVIHIAEHTQRHVGEAIITAKILRAMAAAR